MKLIIDGVEQAQVEDASQFVEAFHAPPAPVDSLAQQQAHYQSPATLPQVYHPMGVCEYQDRVCKFCNAREVLPVIPPSDESVG